MSLPAGAVPGPSTTTTHPGAAGIATHTLQNAGGALVHQVGHFVPVELFEGLVVLLFGVAVVALFGVRRYLKRGPVRP